MQKKIYCVFYILALLLLTRTVCAQEKSFDTVILHGNVYDPAGDRLFPGYNIGLLNGKIAAITKRPISGGKIIDASNMTVTCGFIDTFQRRYGDVFESFRASDGVTTSFCLSSDTSDLVFAKNASDASHVNRVMIFDLRPVLEHEEDGKPIVDDKLLQKLQAERDGGYAGFLVTPDGEGYLPLLERLPLDLPVYLDLGLLEDDAILPFLEKLRAAEGEKKHHVHIIEGNRFYRILKELLTTAQDDGHMTIGGHPFNYLNVNPTKLPPKRRELLRGLTALDRHVGIQFPMDEIHLQKDVSYTVFGLMSDDVMKVLPTSPVLTTESYASFPGPAMNTQDANAFFGRMRLTQTDDGLLRAIRAQTSLPRTMFSGDIHPLINKGKIEIGADADILVFDPKAIAAHSSMLEPVRPTKGLVHAFREGAPVLLEGELQPTAPKARYITQAIPPYTAMFKADVVCDNGTAVSTHAYTIDGVDYYPLSQICASMGIIYRENAGDIYLGNLIRLEMDDTNFTLRNTKKKLDYPIRYAMSDMLIASSDIDKLFDTFYTVSHKDKDIQLTAQSMHTLFDRAVLDPNAVHFTKNNGTVFALYSLSAALILTFLLILRKSGKSTKSLAIDKPVSPTDDHE